MEGKYFVEFDCIFILIFMFNFGWKRSFLIMIICGDYMVDFII